jgi:cellulose biosynthesis protein BcsQ
MKTITIANHKGGVAKTTTALNVAVLLAKQGSRVLACDLDPQDNLALALGAGLTKPPFIAKIYRDGSVSPPPKDK